MNKFLKTIFLTLLFIIEVSLYSQSLTLGFKAGVNYTNISGYYSFSSSYNQSISAGAFVFAPLGKNIDGLFEINYERKGFNYYYQDISTSTQTNGERIYDYITLPFGFKYKFGKNIKPYFKTGIFLALLMSATDIGSEIDYSVTPPLEDSWENSIMYKTESVDLGIFFGFGFQFKVTPKLIFLLEGNLNSGLMLLEPNQILIEEMRNRSFLVSLGFGYTL